MRSRVDVEIGVVEEVSEVVVMEDMVLCVGCPATPNPNYLYLDLSVGTS